LPVTPLSQLVFLLHLITACNLQLNHQSCAGDWWVTRVTTPHLPDWST